jgi:nitroreductase
MSAVPASPPVSRDTDMFQRVARQRRSVYSYLDMPISRQAVERAIDCAVLAPNHHRTHPWRFFVFAAASRNRLAAAYETAARRLGRDAARAVQRAMDAPVMIVVGCVAQTSNPRVERKEEEFAVAASVQNLMLAFAADGIGTLLTTGVLAESDEVHRLVALTAPEARVMGVVNVGYRDTERPLLARPPADGSSATTWMDAA